MERHFLSWVLRVIDAELPDPSFTVDDLARSLGMSTRQLYRRLEKHSSMTPGALIRRRRLERAQEILARDHPQISDVARSVGFRNRRHFSKLFRRTYGVLPVDYRDSRADSADGRFLPPD